MSLLCSRKKAAKIMEISTLGFSQKGYINTFTTQREIPYLQTCTPASLFWRCLTFNKLQNILEKGVFPLFLTNQMITEKFSHL